MTAEDILKEWFNEKPGGLVCDSSEVPKAVECFKKDLIQLIHLAQAAERKRCAEIARKLIGSSEDECDCEMCRRMERRV